MIEAPDPRDDAALVLALRGGDAGALDVLYRRHRDWVARMARRITGSEADALDVLQETLPVPMPAGVRYDTTVTRAAARRTRRILATATGVRLL